jgi:hypothetical protein
MTNLKTLKLELGESELRLVLTSLKGPISRIFPELKVLALPLLYPLQDYWSSLFPKGDISQKLTHLEFAADSLFLAQMPRCLRKLVFYQTQLNQGAIDFRSPPPTLEILDITIYDLNEATQGPLPRTLTDIRLELATVSLPMTNFHRHLPLLLRKLHLVIQASITNAEQMRCLQLSSFSDLRSLTIAFPEAATDSNWLSVSRGKHYDHPAHAIRLNWKTLFPPDLESLEISASMASVDPVLPGSLTSLILTGCVTQSLSMSYTTDDSWRRVNSSLPPSLTRFICPSWTNSGIYVRSGKLPYRITTLLLAGYEFTQELLDALPTTLTSFHIRNWYRAFGKSTFQYPAMCNLTTLFVRRANDIQAIDFDYLPKNMTNLRLCSYGEVLPSSILNSLPTSLTKLHLGGVHANADPFFEVLDSRDLDVISRLQELKELRLDCLLLKAQDEDFASLPRSLRLLHICGETTLTPNCFLHLPRYLQYLTIPIIAEVKESDLRLLPRGLRSLGSINTSFSPESSQYAPSTLNSSQPRGRGALLTSKAPPRSFSSCMDHRTTWNSFLSHNDPLNGAIPSRPPNPLRRLQCPSILSKATLGLVLAFSLFWLYQMVK